MLLHVPPSGSGHEHEMARHSWCLLLLTFNFTGTYSCFHLSCTSFGWKKQFFSFFFLFQPIFYVILCPTHSYETTLDKTEGIKGQELIDTGAYLSYPLYTTRVPVSRLFQQQLICIHYLVLFSCLFAWGHISGELYRFFFPLYPSLLSPFNFHKKQINWIEIIPSSRQWTQP